MKEVVKWMRENEWILLLPLFLIFMYYLIKWKYEKKREKARILSERNQKGDKFIESRNEEIEYFVDESSSAPIRFGSKITWLAIKANSAEEVSELFKKPNKKAFKTNVENGINGAYALNLYVLPKIEDWVIVVNPIFSIDDDKGLKWLVELSKKYGEVQFFGSFRGVGYSAWAKFMKGETIRAYSVADGEIIRDIGKFTDIEIDFFNREVENAADDQELDWIRGDGKLLSICSEQNVFEIAEKWSINPDKIDNYEIRGLGTIIEV